MTGAYRRPALLATGHELDGFECRSPEQTEWLRRHARQSTNSGTTRVLVVTPIDSNAVVAYYDWCMASVSLADAPARVRRGASRYPQPSRFSHASASTPPTRGAASAPRSSRT